MRVSLPGGALLALCGAMLVPAAARGQTIPSPYEYVDTRQEVDVFAGVTGLAKGRFGFGPSGGTIFGARYDISLSGPLAFEVSAAALDGDRDVIDPGRAEGQRVVDQAESSAANNASTQSGIASPRKDISLRRPPSAISRRAVTASVCGP